MIPMKCISITSKAAVLADYSLKSSNDAVVSTSNVTCLCQHLMPAVESYRMIAVLTQQNPQLPPNDFSQYLAKRIKAYQPNENAFF